MALTPLMQQYIAVKKQHQDAIVLFRLGDFYDIFLDDAPIAADLLDLTLTSRGGGGDKVPMCGVPYHAVQGYIARLVKAGKKVALCEQVEDPKTAKGLVKRAVTRVITPSTYVENDAETTSPTLLGMFATSEEWGLALLEPTTGRFQFWNEPERAITDTLGQIAPSEIVATKGLAQAAVLAAYSESGARTAITTLEDWHGGYDTSVECIRAFFGLDSLRALELDTPTTIAVGLVLRFLQEHMQVALPHIGLPKRLHSGEVMLLGPVVERSLELFRPANPDGRGKTLLDVLNEAVTPMGGLRSCLEQETHSAYRLDPGGHAHRGFHRGHVGIRTGGWPWRPQAGRGNPRADGFDSGRWPSRRERVGPGHPDRRLRPKGTGRRGVAHRAHGNPIRVR